MVDQPKIALLTTMTNGLGPARNFR